MGTLPAYDETIVLPRAVRFPVELLPPKGFDPDELATWPRVDGRLEYVDGRLLFLPPCGDDQQDTVTDVVIALGAWVRAHRDFVLGTNEAGIRLGGDTRAADAAIWRRDGLGPRTGGFRRVAPILAVEVAGVDDTDEDLLAKAEWYLSVGTRTVWNVVPGQRAVVVVTRDGARRYDAGEALPEPEGLADLRVAVADLFVQLDESP
jgi:Uma2 family endonuclease